MSHPTPRVTRPRLAATLRRHVLFEGLRNGHPFLRARLPLLPLAADGTLTEDAGPPEEVGATLTLLDSLGCNYYIRSRVSSTVSVCRSARRGEVSLVPPEPGHGARVRRGLGRLAEDVGVHEEFHSRSVDSEATG